MAKVLGTIMSQPWKIIESVPTKDGVLELRQRGERDFLIVLGSQVLMNSVAHRSEVALGRMACSHLQQHAFPRVLVGGLGMGFTLKAILDILPATARVIVAEINPVIREWCQGPLAGITQNSVSDVRVNVQIADVTDIIRRTTEGFDAIILDLYTGPHAASHKRDDPFYGSLAIERMRAALKPDGVLAVWGESYDSAYDNRLCNAGFSVSTSRPGRGGLRHIVYVAKLQNNRGSHR
jgi:spermidine synthase